MKKNIYIILQLCFIALFVSACSVLEPSMQDLKIRAVELKVNELEKDVKELQEEVRSSNKTTLTKNQQAQTKTEQTNIQKYAHAEVKTANTPSQNQQIQPTKKQTSAAQEAIASLAKENEKFPLPPKSPVATTAPKAAEKIVIPPKKVERVAIEKKSAVDKAVTKAGPDNAYKVALNLYRTGKYDEAKEAFRLFLKNFPSSSYVVNALYWLGECDYAKYDYTNAIFAFKDVLARFPQSTKTADALLKTALAYEKLGDSSNASLHVSVLYEDWPNSDASKVAQKLNLKPL